MHLRLSAVLCHMTDYIGSSQLFFFKVFSTVPEDSLVSCNVIMGETIQHICLILLVRSKSQGLGMLKG